MTAHFKSVAVDAVNMQLLINAGEDMLMNDHSRENSKPTGERVLII